MLLVSCKGATDPAEQDKTINMARILPSSMYGSLEDGNTRQEQQQRRRQNAGDAQEDVARGSTTTQQQAGRGVVGRKHWIPVAAIFGVAFGSAVVSTRSGGPTTITTRLPVAATGIESQLREEASSKPSVHGESSGSGASALPSDGGHGAMVDPLAPLEFSATNFYHTRDGKPAQDYPWLKNVKLAEPYRDTTLIVENSRDGFEYYWQVQAGPEDDSAVMATGRGVETTIIFTHPDVNLVVLNEVDPADGGVVRQLKEEVMVKYVRREIRTLTDEERDEVLDAVSFGFRFSLSSCHVCDGV